MVVVVDRRGRHPRRVSLTARPSRGECRPTFDARSAVPPYGLRELVHTDSLIVVVKSRLLPSPFRIGLELSDGSGETRYVTGILGWGRLRRALEACGFTLDQRSAYAYAGGVIGFPKSWSDA
jgi:hypothetical protein